MQLLEHQGKALLEAVGGLPVPRGEVATGPEEARVAASGLGERVVVKAQVPAGGRGKQGGVRTVPYTAAADCAGEVMSLLISGFRPREVLVEETVDAEREFYLAVMLSPEDRSVVLLLSAEGGVDVESAPGKVARIPIPALIGLRDFHVRQAALEAGVDISALPGLIAAAHAVHRLFHEVEADLVEINPLFLTADRRCVAGDVRVIPTEGGVYRREHAAPADPITGRARELGFDLVELDPDGEVGLLSTGAGASMLVVDLFAASGVRPVNFCDLRSGRASGAPERLEHVLGYLGDRPRLRCLAVNFFAGVTDLRAFGVVLTEALLACPPDVPIVARIDGPGAESARARLREIGATVVDGLDVLIGEVTRVVGEGGTVR